MNIASKISRMRWFVCVCVCKKGVVREMLKWRKECASEVRLRNLNVEIDFESFN